MFLNLLNSKQKSLFLELAIKAAETNNEVTSEETTLLGEFAREMQIEPMYNTTKDTSSILEQLASDSSQRERKIIIFEILGIMFSDSVYDEKEKLFVKNIAESFDISQETVEKMVKSLNDYAEMFNRLTKLILE